MLSPPVALLRGRENRKKERLDAAVHSLSGLEVGGRHMSGARQKLSVNRNGGLFVEWDLQILSTRPDVCVRGVPDHIGQAVYLGSGRVPRFGID